MAERVDPIYYLRRTPTVMLQRIACEVRRTRRVTTSTAVSSVYAVAGGARAERVEGGAVQVWARDEDRRVATSIGFVEVWARDEERNIATGFAVEIWAVEEEVVE